MAFQKRSLSYIFSFQIAFNVSANIEFFSTNPPVYKISRIYIYIYLLESDTSIGVVILRSYPIINTISVSNPMY